MNQYVVIKPHHSTYPDPITLKTGDKVIYGKEDTEYPNWVFCTSTSGKEGWVPKQILSQDKLAPFATVSEDYSAHELTVKVGETLTGLHQLNEWTFCCRDTGEEGWIPDSCLKKIT
ncbi:SH3 domain-containing protein [Rossellomorea marisflavi]|uniref:SH3 domain-containing protein n=1 Tax=Rossellomorea marisflavi TaxID=189381 RepID=UPI00203E7A29|nr:SH3 domain-containing protein [Rossellomorea marisflavi]MCM2588128.1 SH3 domain-containing protein [Rossellomorea marisflavi]